MKILIRGGMLIDGLGGREDNLEWLEIKDGFIVRIDKKGSSTVPQAHEEADQIIEAQGLAVCPGLINAHLHLYLDGGKSPLHDLAQEKSHLSLLKAAARAKKVLHNGVTTVRDLGAKDYGIIALRQAIAEGLLEGPRIVACGPAIAMTGGHAQALATTADGNEEMRRAVRQRLQEGADFIKVFATGGFGKMGEQLEFYELRSDEITTAVETAGSAGKKVAAHAYGNQGIRNAIAAGVHSIEHGSYLDDETIDELVRKEIFLVPTLSNTLKVSTLGGEMGLPPFMVETAKMVFPVMLKNFQKAYRAGMKLPAGTDGGSWFNPVEDLVTELKLRAELGVPNSAVIRMATITAAQCLGLDKELGSLETGKRADVILVEGNPLMEVNSLANVRVVIRDGRVIRQDRAKN